MESTEDHHAEDERAGDRRGAQDSSLTDWRVTKDWPIDFEHEPLQEPQVLDVERLVEPEELLHLVDALRRRRLPRRQACRVAGTTKITYVTNVTAMNRTQAQRNRLTRYRATSSWG